VRSRTLGAAVLALALAGCTGADQPSSGEGGVTSTAQQSTSSAQSSPDGEATPIAAEAVQGLVQGRIITDSLGASVTYTPVTLRREENLLLLEIAAHNNEAKDSANLLASIGDGNPTFNSATLVDSVNKKRYLVARDSNDQCLCSKLTLIDPGTTGIVTAYYAAPPASVSSMTIDMPDLVGSFSDVPISS
jgi:hypothetical protein